MADKEIKKTAPKKKTPVKKKTVFEAGNAPPQKISHKIYEDPSYLKPAQSSHKDIVKILPRNPFQAYVFWKIHPDHFDHVSKEFGANDPSEIQLKLKLEYVSQTGKAETAWYDLAPMTKSYFCNFPGPVKQLQAFVYASYFGKLKLFLETGNGDLPPGVESFSLDAEWIHPKWVELGWIKKTREGDWKFTDQYDPGKDELYDLEVFGTAFDGSSRTSSRAGSQTFRKESKA